MSADQSVEIVAHQREPLHDGRSSLNAVVLQRIELDRHQIILRVAPDQWSIPEFEPGQFAVLGLPGSSPRCADADPEDEPPPTGQLIKRAYSIASSSVLRHHLECYISLVPSGTLTPRLFALRPGDRLWLGAKLTGLFTLDAVPADKHLVLVGTGTGLAPYISRPTRSTAFVRTRLPQRTEQPGAPLWQLHLSVDDQPARPRANSVDGPGWLCSGPVAERPSCRRLAFAAAPRHNARLSMRPSPDD